MPLITVNKTKCIGCSACVNECPSLVLELKDKKSEPVHEERCIVCGHCVAVCPTGAISHEKIDSKQCLGIKPGFRLPYDKLENLLRVRRSTRNFLDKSISKQELEKLVSISRYAPLAHNHQDFGFIVLTDKEKIAKIKSETAKFYSNLSRHLTNPVTNFLLGTFGGRKMALWLAHTVSFFKLLEAEAVQGKDRVFYGAPAMIIAYGKKDFFAKENSVYACYNILLAAESLGYGACVIGWADYAMDKNRAMVKEMGLDPKHYRFYHFISVGIPKYKYRKLVPRNMPEVKVI